MNTVGTKYAKTPATAGWMVVAAYDFDGNRRWLVRPGVFNSTHGFCSPPLLFEDLVILNGDHDGDSYLVALKRSTGETVWKVPRKHRIRSYCPPIIRQIDGRTQMVLSGAGCVASYDPHNGKQHWIIEGPTEQYVASLVYNGKLFFMTAGFPTFHILAIRPDGEGDVTKTHVVWQTTKGCAYVPSPIIAGEGRYLLVVADGGMASCFEAQTGERYWKERIGPHFSASPVEADGRVYFLSDRGVTTVIRPGPEFTRGRPRTNSARTVTPRRPSARAGSIFAGKTTYTVSAGSKLSHLSDPIRLARMVNKVEWLKWRTKIDTTPSSLSGW